MANIYASQAVASRPAKCAMNDARDQITSFTITGCDWGKIVYLSSAPSVVDIDPDTAVIKAQGLGLATITATLKAKGCTGDGQTYACEVEVVDGRPLPEMRAITKVLGDPPFMLEYSADIDNHFTYASSNEAVATISGKQVTIRGVGETTITATKNDARLLNGRQKSVTSTLTVRAADQKITYTGPTACTYGQACIAQATALGGIVNFESDTLDICIVTAEGAILAKKNETGVCHIRAWQNGNADYKTQAIVMNASTLSLGDLPHGTYKTRYSEALTTTGGYGPYHYQVTSGSLPAGLELIKKCGEWELSGTLDATPGFVHFTLTATDENQVSTSRSYSFYIKKAELIISNTDQQRNHSLSVPDGRSHTVEKMPGVWINKVADNNSLSMLKYESTNSEICSVENNNGALTIKGNSVGEAQIIASLKKAYQGDYFCPANYCPLGDQQQEPKAVVYTCQVTPIKKKQTIHFLAAEDKKWHIAVSPNNRVLMRHLDDATYETPYSQTLTTTGGYAPYTYALASGSKLPAGLVLTEKGILKGLPTGRPTKTVFTVIVTDANGVKMPHQYELEINKAPSYIKFSYPSVSLVYGWDQEMTAYAADANGNIIAYPNGRSHSEIYYHSDMANICQVSNEGQRGLVRATGVGRTQITATLKGNEYYEDAKATYSCTVNRAQKTVSYRRTTDCTYGQPCKINWTASGGEVKFASKTTDICTVTAQGDITQKKLGTCIISAHHFSAHQSGNANHLPSHEVNQKIEMLAAKPSISNLMNLTTTYAKNKTILLNLTSTSQGKFSYASSNPRVATVDAQGRIAILDGTGDTPITITVTQNADGNYAAVTEKITLTILPRDNELKQIYGDGPMDLEN